MAEVLMGKKGLIERVVTFTPTSFDIFKDYQRAYQDRMGVRFSNSEVLAIMLNRIKELEG